VSHFRSRGLRLLAPFALVVAGALPAADGIEAPAGWSRDRDGGWLSPNLVANPSAESGRRGKPAGWTFHGKGGDGAWERLEGRSGRRSLRIAGAGAWESDPFPLRPGLITTVAVDARLEGSGRWGSQARLEFRDRHGSLIDRLGMHLREEHGWWTLRTAGAAPQGTATGVLVAYLGAEGLRAWYDNLDVRQWIDRGSASTTAEEPAASVRGFDFGSGDSQLLPGYARVSPATRYSRDAGYGWLASVRLRGENQPEEAYRSGTVDARGEPVPRGRTHLDPLSRDTIVGRGTARFRVDLPAGRYRVFVLAGHQKEQPPEPYFDLVVSLGGERAGRLSKRHPRVGYVWSTFLAQVGDDGLSVGLASDRFGGVWSVAGLIVYPEEAAVGGRREVERVLKALERAPADVMGRWRRVPLYPAAMAGAPPVDGGPTLASFPAVAEVLPATPLHEGSPVDKITGRASPGLSADVTFSLRPSRPLQDFRLEVDPFSGPGGAALPAGAVQVWAVKLRALRYNRFYVDPAYYRLRPDALDPRLPARLEAGRTARFWLRVRAPEDAVAGTYHSTVRWTARDHQEQVLPVKVQVLPFAAARVDLFQNPYLYADAGSLRVETDPETREEARRVRVAAIRDAVDHLGSVVAYLPRWPVYREQDGTLAVETFFARERLEDFRLAGHPPRKAIVILQPILRQLARQMLPEKEASKFDKHLSAVPDVGEEFWKVFGDLVDTVDRMLEVEGVEERVYNPFDEPRGHDVAFYVQAVRVLRQRLGDPLLFCDVPPWIYHGREDQPALAPWCNVWWVYGTLTDPEREVERRRGTRLMGRFEVNSPAGARAAAGLLRWRRREVGGNWWAYDGYQGSVNTQMDGPSYGDRCLVYPTVPPSPRVVWEATRMGHEDLRYLRTLEEAVGAADHSCPALRRAAGRAERFLEDLGVRVDPTIAEPFTDPADYDRARRDTLEAIQAIREATLRCQSPAEAVPALEEN
jgi:hypothetical protein